MTSSNSARIEPANVIVQHVAPSRTIPTLREDVAEGLSQRPRELHPKYFYDERGSELFDAICDTPEYYLTRTEFELLERHGWDILAATEPHNMLELGSGTSRKTRLLLSHWHQPGGVYWPFDVSAEMLEKVAGELTAEYPSLSIHGLVGDYTAGFGNFPDLDGKTLAMFLGSTLGNFAPEFAESFLADFASHLDFGDYLLIGADLDKDPGVIEAAYNDAQGITAEFNRNVLRVMNAELGATFNPEAFTHKAIYNRELRRIEMYLISDRDQDVEVRALGRSFDFRAGEKILTEISRKFRIEDLQNLMRVASMKVVETFVHPQRPYALMLGRKSIG